MSATSCSEPNRSWRLTMDADVPVRPCVRGSVSDHESHIRLDLRFDGLTPAIGTDGQPAARQRSAEAAAAAGSTGKGHFEQAGSWTGWLEVDGEAHVWNGALGNRDRSWGPRNWGGPTMWRWFSINIDEDLHFGGIRLGTPTGDLHRGWVFDHGVATSVAEWRLRTELADDGLTQRVVHLTVRGQEGPGVRVGGSGAPCGRYRTHGRHPDQRRPDPLDLPGRWLALRIRHRRVPPPTRRRREACRPGRLMGDPTPDVVGRARSGLRRHGARPDGGCPEVASRITSSFDLESGDGSRRRLILQQDRADGMVPGGRVRTEASLLMAARDAGVPVPEVVAAGAADGLPPGWLVVERLDGETIPREAPARSRVGRRPRRSGVTVRCSSGRHPSHRPRRRGRASPARPAP